jgi:hypothetical protein
MAEDNTLRFGHDVRRDSKGSTLTSAIASSRDGSMREWPFFQSSLDLVEMVLAKAEPRIAAHNDRTLVPPDLAPPGQRPADAVRRNGARSARPAGKGCAAGSTGRERDFPRAASPCIAAGMRNTG